MIQKILSLSAALLLLSAAALANPVLEAQTSSAEFTSAWSLAFETTEGGRLAMTLSGTGNEYSLGSTEVLAGRGEIRWDGCLPDGTAVPGGGYELSVALRNYWGEESETLVFPLTIPEGNGAEAVPEDTLDLDDLEIEDADEWTDAESWTDIEPSGQIAPVKEDQGVSEATSFWDMDPDAYDLEDPEHQQAIWDLMMQPITVLDVGQTEHVYPTREPGMSIKPYKTNTAGELHGQSAGVHVLEEDTDGDGYVLIEAYSNDGTVTKDDYMKSIDNQLIRGYVKKSLLKTVKPSDKYALLIDKLRQKLYIFEAGRIIGTLDVSTGLNNKTQPYNESPAGEFITISKVGEFVAGTMRANYAIRINGGTLLHEVPYRYGKDGTTKLYDEFESKLGQKASHGCIRIQRRKNSGGQNMLWLWDHLELRTRVFIWNDQGRTLKPELPDASTPLYRNPNGGSNYHLDQNCSGVKSKFLPLTGDFTYGDLQTGTFSKLTPCAYCNAPARPSTLYERFKAEAEQIGYTVTDEDKALFGVQ